MSFREDSRVQAAIALLKGAPKISATEDSLVEFLENETGGSAQALGSISFESLEKSLSLPRALARTIGTALRPDKAKDGGAAKTARLKALNASEATPEELVAEVCKKPLQRNSRFFRSLKRLVGDAAVMVWVDGVVDESATVARVKEVMLGGKLRDVVTVGNKPVVPLELGVAPDRELKEHPLFPGVQLFADGTGEDGQEWGALDYRTRLFLAFLVSKRELGLVVEKGDVFKLNTIYQSAASGDIFKSYSRHVVEFNQIVDRKRVHVFSTLPSRTTSRLSGSF